MTQIKQAFSLFRPFLRLSRTLQANRSVGLMTMFLLPISSILLSCSQKDIEVFLVKHDNSYYTTEYDIIRSEEEARLIAEHSLSIIENNNDTRAVSPRHIISKQQVTAHTTRSGADTPIFYIFNFNDNAGFSVISARKDISPIIAITEKGNYTYGVPTGVDPFDEYMQMATNSIISFDRPIRPIPTDSLYVKTKTEDIERSCNPLVQTRWGQKQIFGMYCPNKVAGCGATAMAQIMSYHKFPKTITTTYADAPYAGKTINIPWDKIIPHIATENSCLNELDCISNHYTIGALLREIGERIYMSYYDVDSNVTASSGCKPYDIPDGFRDFGYKSDKLQVLDTAAIFRSLDNKMPLIASGKQLNSDALGHIWVIDGYRYNRHIVKGQKMKIIITDQGIRTEYVWDTIIDNEEILIHHNWGHDGRCNGFFDYGIYKMNDATEFDDDNSYNNFSSDYCMSLQIIPNITPTEI